MIGAAAEFTKDAREIDKMKRLTDQLDEWNGLNTVLN
jgi:hypothetical protein